MGNIIDYVKEEMRKADEKPFSEVDSLVLCQFSYLLFDGIVPGFEQECGKTTVKDLYKAEFFLLFSQITDPEKKTSSCYWPWLPVPDFVIWHCVIM